LWEVCARLVAIGKELIDLSDGDPDSHPEIKDAVATLDGVECGENSYCDMPFEDCCAAKGYSP